MGMFGNTIALPTEVHLHFPEGITINVNLQGSEQGQGPTPDEFAAAVTNQVRTYMDPRLQTISDKLQEIQDETGQYIADRDALDAAKDALIAEKDATIADLQAQLAAGKITIQQFSDGLDAAQAKALAAADLLPALRVPPVVTPALAAWYGSADDFNAALAAYTGPEQVTLDGAEVKVGDALAVLAYFTHSADGSVSTTGPTD